jgi:PAS domain S-box-containing protein
MDAGAERTSILLVDDRPANLIALQAILDRKDYHLVAADSGRRVLELLPKHDFAVVLLDVAMPEMDGFATAHAIKKQPEQRDVPIIFITAVAEDLGWAYRAYDVGAIDFLEKPLDPHVVRAKVAFFVQLHRQRRQLERQQQKLREQERALQEMRFRNLADAIPHIVWVATPSGDVEYVSRRWQTWSGRPTASALGRRWIEAVPEAAMVQVLETWNARIASGEPFEFELQLVDARGAVRWHAMRGLPERNDRGQVTRWLGTLTEVEEQRRLRDDLAASVQLRDEFIQVAAHELRTPLSALKLRLGSMQRRPAAEPEEIRRNVGLVARQVDRLAELVERLLDVSRLQSGRMELNLEATDLARIARDTTERMSEEAKKAGCALDVSIPPSLPGVWDRLRVEQVIVNLLSNACKYGAGRPIRLQIDSDETIARVTVHDEGIGIPADAMGRIFGRFERAVSARNYGGLGLGLYLVAQIVEAHGGKVHAESSPEKGATFVVELPRGVRAAARVVTQK